MCVAAIISKPISLTYLEAMDTDNPHGAGVAWYEDGAIRFERGLDAAAIFELQEQGILKFPYLLHFRWATHGARVAELTHPFPVGPRALMGELSGTAESVLIHNGTWNGYEPYIKRYIDSGNMEFPEELISLVSDTAVAAWLMDIYPEILDEVKWSTAVATVENDGMHIKTRGSWSDYEGNQYSNLTWVPGYKWASHYETDLGWRYLSAGVPSYYEPMNSAKDTVDPREISAANDPKYIGRTASTLVNSAWYNVWYPEKDTWKPDLTPWGDWYDRFNWENTASGSKASHNLPTAIPAPDTGEEGTLASEHSSDASCLGSNQSESDWYNYLRTKYGDAVASELLVEHERGEAVTLERGEAVTLEKLCQKEVNPYDTDIDTDELVSDNPSEVNAWLAKKMLP